MVMSGTTRPHRNVAKVVHQHTEDSAILRNMRSGLVAAGHVRIKHLARLDERICAHLDGLAVAGEGAWPFCDSALETPGIGQVFAAAVRPIEEKNTDRLNKLFALVESVPDALPGLTSAFGWVSAQFLQGTIKDLLSSHSPLRQRVGIACCAMHRIDPGITPPAGRAA